MTQDREPDPKLMDALPIMQAILDAPLLYRGRIAGFVVADTLGIPDDEAAEIVARFQEARAHNEFPGGVRAIPEFDPDTPPSQQTPELQRRAAFFLLGHVEDATEADDHSTIYLGSLWLGNSDDDTRALVEDISARPQVVVDFLRWAFDNDPSLERVLVEYEHRAQSGTLRPPSLDW